jgi:hypothetical protein
MVEARAALADVFQIPNPKGIEAAAKVIYDRYTDRRDPGSRAWENASHEDKGPFIKEAMLVIRAYLSCN